MSRAMNRKSVSQVKSTTASSAFSLSMPGMLQRKCDCGGVAGLTGQCEECSGKRLSGQGRVSNSPAAGDEVSQMAPLTSTQQLPGHSFGRMSVQAKLAIHELNHVVQQGSGGVQLEGVLEEAELLQGKFITDGMPSQLQTTSIPGENRTGMPDALKTGLEHLSGLDLSGLRVHYNSAKPAQLNALAYTQGQDIEVGPGQDHHLPHEGWHVVQQMQGRVKPTMQAKGVLINDDFGLEKEADMMGAKAMQLKTEATASTLRQVSNRPASQTPVQRMLVGIEMETIVPLYQNGSRPDHVDGYAAQANEYDHANVDETLRQPLGKGFELHIDSSSRAPQQALQWINPGAKMHIMEIVGKPVASRKALLLKLQIARNFLSTFKGYSEVSGDDYSAGWPIPNAPFTQSQQIIPKEKLEEVFAKDYKNGKGRLYDVATQLTFQVPPDHLKFLSDKDTKKYDTGRKEKTTKFRKGIPSTVMRSIQEEHPIVNRDSMAAAMFLSDGLHNKYIRRIVDITVKIFKDTLKLLQEGISGTVKNSVSYLIRSDLGALFPEFPPQIAQQMAKNVATILELTTIDELKIPDYVLKEIYDAKHDALILNPKTFRSITNPQKSEEGELEHINKDLRISLNETATHLDDTERKYWPWRVAMKWLGNEVGKTISQDRGQVTGPLHGSQNLGLLPERNQESELKELQQIEAVSQRWQQDPENYPYPDEAVDQGNHDKGLAQMGVVIEDRAGLAIDIEDNKLPAAVVERLDQMEFPKE
jgi:Domain of unknown function (DUF4157)